MGIEKVQLGDIIGYRSFDIAGLIVMLGELISAPKLGGEYSFTHVAIVSGIDSASNQIQITEAISKGVKSKMISMLPNKSVVKRLNGIQKEHQLAIAAKCIDLASQGIKYNWLQLFFIGILKILRLEFVKNIFNSDKSTICSMFIGRVMKETSSYIYPGYLDGNLDPKDIMTDPNFSIVAKGIGA